MATEAFAQTMVAPGSTCAHDWFIPRTIGVQATSSIPQEVCRRCEAVRPLGTPDEPPASIIVELTRAQALSLTGNDWESLRYEFPNVTPNIVAESRGKLWSKMGEVGWSSQPLQEPFEPCENLACGDGDCERERLRRGQHVTWVMQLWGSLGRSPGDTYRAHCCCGWSGSEHKGRANRAFRDCDGHAPGAIGRQTPLLPNVALGEEGSGA